MMLVFAELTASRFLGGPFNRVSEDIVHTSFALGWYQFIFLQVSIVTIHIWAQKLHVMLRSKRLVDILNSLIDCNSWYISWKHAYLVFRSLPVVEFVLTSIVKLIDSTQWLRFGLIICMQLIDGCQTCLRLVPGHHLTLQSLLTAFDKGLLANHS